MSTLQLESTKPSGAAIRRIAVPWICYLAYFVGVSFQSGGIVHYSLDQAKYGSLVAIGAVIFVVGAVSSDLISPTPILRSTGPLGFLLFVVSALTLSIGVGMIGGGVQHFSDIPERAPILIPLGIVLSILGYCGRFRPQHHAKEVIVSVAAAVVLAIPTHIVLQKYAETKPAATADGHSDSHATAGSSEPPAVVPSTVPATQVAPTLVVPPAIVQPAVTPPGCCDNADYRDRRPRSRRPRTRIAVGLKMPGENGRG